MALTITRNAAGVRKVTAPANVDGEKLLDSLNRDFVLLDHKTLQSFIDDKALEGDEPSRACWDLPHTRPSVRNRKGLANARAFNNHFEVKVLTQQETSLKAFIAKQQAEAVAAFHLLTQTSLHERKNHAAAVVKAHDALHAAPGDHVHRPNLHGADRRRLSAIARTRATAGRCTVEDHRPTAEGSLTGGPTKKVPGLRA